MRLNVDNFDDQALKSTSKEPYLTLHKIRDLLKTQASSAKKEEGKISEEPMLDQQELEEQFVGLVKNLVDCPLYDLSFVTLPMVKDVFNALGERIAAWRTLQKEDEARIQLGDQKQEGLERLILFLRAAALISFQPAHGDKVDNPNCLIEMIKECSDPRVTIHASKVYFNVGGPLAQARNQEIVERVTNIAFASNLLRQASNHITLREIANDTQKNGESLSGRDFHIEVERQTHGLNGKNEIHQVSIPRDKILNKETSPTELVESIFQEHFRGYPDSSRVKLQLEAKLNWFRFSSTQSGVECVKLILQAIKAASNYKVDTKQYEYLSYVREPFIEECIEILSSTLDKELQIQVIHALCAVYRGKAEMASDPFLKVAPLPSDDSSSTENESFLLKSLKDLSGITVEQDGLTYIKVASPAVLNPEAVKSSYFQWCFLRLAKIIITSINIRQLINPNEISPIVGCLLKIDSEVPSNKVYAYHLRVANEASLLLRNFARHRHDEQHEIVKKLEAKLAFEIENLENSLTTTAFEGEDFYQEQEQADRQQVIKSILNLLNDLINKSIRENAGFGRRVLESTIPAMILSVLSFNNSEKASVVNEFVSVYIAFIGMICSESPGATPQLIKNAVIQTIFKSLKDRLPETNDAFYLALVSINHMSLHEEGRKLAEEIGPLKSIMQQYVYDQRFSEIMSNSSTSISLRMQLFQLFDRNPADKVVVAEQVGEFLTTIELSADSFAKQYIEICTLQSTPAERIEHFAAMKKTSHYKTLNQVMQMMIILTSTDDQGHDRANNTRHIQEIFSSSTIDRLLKVFVNISENPVLYNIQVIFTKILRSLVEVQQFPATVTKFVDMIGALDQQFQIRVGQLTSARSFDFTLKSKQIKAYQEGQEEPKEGDQSGLQSNIVEVTELCDQISAKFHSLLVLIKTICLLHSATFAQIIQNEKLRSLLKTLFYITRVLLSMKTKQQTAKYTSILQSDDETEQFVKLKGYLSLTQKEYQGQKSAETKAEIVAEFNKIKVGLSRDGMLKEAIPGLSFSSHVIDELIQKFSEQSFNQRHIRDRDLNRNPLENNLKFLGKIMYKHTKDIRAVTQRKEVDMEVSLEGGQQPRYKEEELETLISLSTQLDLFNKLCAKNCLCGASFYTFYSKGGLHNMLEIFNWLGEWQSKIKEEEITRLHFTLFEKVTQHMHIFFHKHIIDDEKSGLARQNDVFIQSIANIKMGSAFDSIKHFYQNVCYTLITKTLSGGQNPLIVLNKPGMTYLFEVALSILSSAQKNFSNCSMLKVSINGAQRQAEQHQGRPQRQPNPMHVQQLLDMQMGTRERIIQALQQTRDNVEQALQLLLEQQQLGIFGLEGFEEDPIEGDNLSSGSDNEQAIIFQQITSQANPTQPTLIQEKKVQKVNEGQFSDELKVVQTQGFKWVIEAYESIDSAKSQSFILESLKHGEGKTNSDLDGMFAKIDEVIKKGIDQVFNLLPQILKRAPDEDEKKVEADVTELASQISKVSGHMRTLQKVIINGKGYFKAALKGSVANYILQTIQRLYSILSGKEGEESLLKECKSVLGSGLNKLIIECLMLQMNLAQMSFLFLGSLASKEEDNSAPKQIEKIKKAINFKSIFESSIKLVQLSKQGGVLSFAVLQSSIALALRVVIDKLSLEADHRAVAIQTLFNTLSEVLIVNKNMRIDQKIISSIAILYFESEPLIKDKMEQLVSRILFTKYEYENGQKAVTVDQHLQTKHGFPTFLTFFKSLSAKSQELFKATLGDQCDIHAPKKNSVDKATISLKEKQFADVKKQITQERGLFKQFIKQTDDKQLKQQIKLSLKALNSQIPEFIQKDLQAFLGQLYESTSKSNEDLSGFLAAQQQYTPYIITEEQANQLFIEGQNFILDMLSKLCLAYPAYSVVLLPQGGNKAQTFFQWYIKEYIPSQLLQKSMKKSEVKAGEPAMVEVAYSMKQDYKLVDNSVSRFINKLTGYNHYMGINEQVVKHQLRSKFMIEALTQLQRVVKDKSTAQGNQLKQKCLLLSCLSVIEALVNGSQQKSVTISQDNFINSIRTCFVRDASQKDLNLPVSFLKLMDEVFTDFIDVTLPSNSDIVGKCINIVKIVADFINTNKKGRKTLERTGNSSLEDLQIRAEQLLQIRAEQLLGAVENQAVVEEQVVAAGEDHAMNEEDINIQEEDPEQFNQEAEEDLESDEEDEMMDDDEMNPLGVEVEEEFDEDDGLDDDHLDEEEDDDDDDDGMGDEDLQRMIRAGQGHRAGQQNDIINPRGEVPPQRHWRHVGGDHDRRLVERNQQWSEEETLVQRILTNLRGNQSQNPEPRAAEPYYRPYDDRHLFGGPPANARARGEQPDGTDKKGLVEQTYEDFKVISDQELLAIVGQQRNALDEESRQKVVLQQAPAGGRMPAVRDRQHLLDMLLAGAHPGLARPFNRIVDEVDEIDIIEHRIGGANPFGNPFLEGLIRADDMRIMAINDDNPLGMPLWQQMYREQGRPVQVPFPQESQYDVGLYQTHLRNQNNQHNQNSNDLLGQALLQSMNVILKPEEQPPAQQQPASQLDPVLPPSILDPAASNDQLLSAFFQMPPAGGQPAQRTGPLFQMPQMHVNQIPPLLPQGIPPNPFSANPAPVIQNVPPQQLNAMPQSPAQNSELREVMRRIEQSHIGLLGEISQQQESLQNIVLSQHRSNESAQQPIINPSSNPTMIQTTVVQQQLSSPRLVQEQEAPVVMQQIPPIPQPVESIADMEVSAFESEFRNLELQQQQRSQEAQPVQQQAAEEEKKEEAKANQQPERQTTFGYDNELLLENGIDPDILADLPEDMRAEILSSIDIPPVQAQAPASQSRQNQEEEKKQEQPANANDAAQQQPEYYAIAQALGLDPEFLANLPEDMRMELIQQAQMNQQPVQRQPEAMDIASFVATVTDQTLRREIFMNMDEATVATLPPHLLAEARQVQNYIRDRQRAREQAPADRARGLLEQMNMGLGGPGVYDNDPMAALFGRRRDEQLRQRELQNARREKTLEEIVAQRQKQISDEIPSEDIVASLSNQVVQNEKILEQLVLILIMNEKIECDLIPCLQSLLKIQSSAGVLVIRNKLIHFLTFLLKSLCQQDEPALKAFYPNHTLKVKQSGLILIGTIRLLLKQSNRSLMKYILKGLITPSVEQPVKGLSTQLLKKQYRFLLGKAVPEPTTMLTLEQAELIEKQKASFVPPSPLSEIFSLVKCEQVKQDKTLMRNLSLLIHQILKHFETAREELSRSNDTISKETIQSIAEILSLEIIDQTLIADLGDFLYQISLQKRENFFIISEYCGTQSSSMIERLITRLEEAYNTFNDVRARQTPSRGDLGAIMNREFSQNSAFEEEKQEDVMMIDTSSAIEKPASKSLKLSEEDQKLIRASLKVGDDSQVLLRLFKLYNLFYEAFQKRKAEEKNESVEESLKISSAEAITFLKESFQSPQMQGFVRSVNEILRIVFRANIELTEGVSNLILCVFFSFSPELTESLEKEEQKRLEEQQLEEAKEGKKFKVRMMPLTDGAGADIGSKGKYSLFRNPIEFTDRIDQLNTFCLANKRLINKMIKSNPTQYTGEIGVLIKHMPNLLDFDNKRAYFKKEMAQKRRSIYQDQIQLFIRRDQILTDSFHQLKDRSAEELQGRFHIQFTGERGQDAGGLTRDFYIELSREMFNPNYSLFKLSNSGSTYFPNPKSYIEAQHLAYFKFIGRMIGKALFDECLLECYFVKSLYKMMTGEPLVAQDVEDFDNEYYNNIKWCLENDVSCLMTTFSVEQDYFGKSQEIDLIPDGRKIAVTNENKREYLQKTIHYRLYKQIHEQIDAFLEGFYDLVPKELVSMFNHKELELLISGLPNFDLDDLKANTEYSGYSAQSPQVQWLWEVLEVLENSERAEFLQFVTGSSKVPLDGFKGLIGMRGPQKFTIAKIKSDDIMRLPSGHTCFNQLDLPEYPSKELLHERLLIAIKETKGFGFA